MTIDDTIERITRDLSSRTAWGVCLDAMELIKLKTQAENTIIRIDDTLLWMEEWVKKYVSDPVTPEEEEEE